MKQKLFSASTISLSFSLNQVQYCLLLAMLLATQLVLLPSHISQVPTQSRGLYTVVMLRYVQRLWPHFFILHARGQYRSLHLYTTMTIRQQIIITSNVGLVNQWCQRISVTLIVRILFFVFSTKTFGSKQVGSGLNKIQPSSVVSEWISQLGWLRILERYPKYGLLKNSKAEFFITNHRQDNVRKVNNLLSYLLNKGQLKFKLDFECVGGKPFFRRESVFFCEMMTFLLLLLLLLSCTQSSRVTFDIVSFFQ